MIKQKQAASDSACSPKGAHAASLSLSSRLPCDFGLAVVCLSSGSIPLRPLLSLSDLGLSPASPLPASPFSLSLSVCDLKTWDLGSSVCVCYHMCVCVCARSWDLQFFKVLIGHSVFDDAAGDEPETSCERQRLLAQRRACCPGLPRGLVRVPATRAPPSAAPAPRAIDIAPSLPWGGA